ncbi:ArsR/SmtB family transcription factor [Isoptericola croceus]|uniref:ArsR/SmtB family transcription factor n=1 Tax=Isoptericola croceus TaxID=3031406 RepID=UPI0023F65CB3|nr:metalloregulator ArsR/SmtB family transcription factor [Isoptericola croceus]
MTSSAVVQVCSALGDENRWQILRMLGERPRSASALAAELPISRQAIAQHVEVLVRAGLVERERHGREVRYVPVGAALSAAVGQLQAAAAGWDRRLEALRRRAEGSAEVSG